MTRACPSGPRGSMRLPASISPSGSGGPRNEGYPNRGARTRSGVDPTTSGFPLDPLRTTVLGSASASGSCFQRRTSERATHGATSPRTGT